MFIRVQENAYVRNTAIVAIWKRGDGQWLCFVASDETYLIDPEYINYIVDALGLPLPEEK